MKRIVVFICICSFADIPLSAQTNNWADTVAKIERILSRYKSNNPGIQVSISRNGELLFSRAWGMADMEHNIPLSTSSVTEAGSVSKQFTAAAILLLEQEGKLSLEDDVRKYIPELPAYGRVITLRNMLQHTSGLKDWGSIAAIGGWPRTTKTYSNEDALYIIAHQKTLNNPPGDEYIYSNSNYNLLAIIVQRVSGINLYDFSNLKIFQPAGMTHTEWRANYKKIVPNRAIAYSKGADGYFTNMPNEYVYGNGGLLTTTEDLIRWNNYYASGKLGSPSLLQKQIATSKFTNGNQHYYAAGLNVGQFRDMEVWFHGGATAGYRSHLDYFPGIGLSIAWLSNTSEYDGNSFNITTALREIFVPGATKEIINSRPADIFVPEEKLKTYTGWYKNSASGESLSLYLKNGELSGNQWPVITPTGEGQFITGTNRITFMQGNKLLQLISANRDTTRFIRMDAGKIHARNIREYTGEYYSEETETKFIINIKNNKLLLQQKPATAYILTPSYKNGFESNAGTIWFERDKNKKIIRLKISVPRARNVQFDKLK